MHPCSVLLLFSVLSFYFIEAFGCTMGQAVATTIANVLRENSFEASLLWHSHGMGDAISSRCGLCRWWGIIYRSQSKGNITLFIISLAIAWNQHQCENAKKYFASYLFI